MMDGSGIALVGACFEIITEALLIARPEWREREVVDDLRVTALYAAFEDDAVCLLSYDICEMASWQALRLRRGVAEVLGIDPLQVHVFCTHTHSSSCENDHDLALLEKTSRDAARNAREAAKPVGEVHFLRVDTGSKYNINRRTVAGPLGTWCLMQSRGCVDDGTIVDGTGWVRERMRTYGATPDDVASIDGPFPATRPNDPFLELVLFPAADGGYAGGLVRFTAHAVVCSAGYWRPNLGRDYPGQLCDLLGREYGCPILFLPGPCGDHRPRHRDVGIEERDRIARGLAKELTSRLDEIQKLPFDALGNESVSIPCPLVPGFPASLENARRHLGDANRRLDELAHGAEWLKQRKELAEERDFYAHAVSVLDEKAYLGLDDVKNGTADLEISHVNFGNVHLLNFEGELFSTVVPGLEQAAGGPTIVTSFADGVTGYLMPPADFAEGGYERTWALFAPESIAALRSAAVDLLK